MSAKSLKERYDRLKREGRCVTCARELAEGRKEVRCEGCILQMRRARRTWYVAYGWQRYRRKAGMRVKVGDWVRHYGTRRWGQVLEVVQQGDGSSELKIEREVPFGECERNPTWWATYHVDVVLGAPPTDEDRRRVRAWRPLGGLA
jgi:hypothetical protein